jgi:hypothetical protein
LSCLAIVGGLIGAARFTLDILRNALKLDLGPLNQVVEFSFLNFSVIVFLFCVALMVAVSKATGWREFSGDTGLILQWRSKTGSLKTDTAITAPVAAATLGLWWHPLHVSHESI